MTLSNSSPEHTKIEKGESIYLGLTVISGIEVRTLILNPYNQNKQMSTITVALKVQDMKTVKLGSQLFDYYLRIQYLQEDSEITACKNIIKESEVFELKGGKRPTKIEIWDYNRQKCVATLMIRKFNPEKVFEGKLQKANLSVRITKSVSKGQLQKEVQPQSAIKKALSQSTSISLHDEVSIDNSLSL